MEEQEGIVVLQVDGSFSSGVLQECFGHARDKQGSPSLRNEEESLVIDFARNLSPQRLGRHTTATERASANAASPATEGKTATSATQQLTSDICRSGDEGIR